MASNLQAVDAFRFQDSIKESFEDAKIKLELAQKRYHELKEMVELGERTTEVFAGVALSVFENSVSATDWSINRWAEVYEHVRQEGCWFVRTYFRGGRDRNLDETFASREEALQAAKKFVAGI